MNTKELNELYESGFYKIICENLTNKESNTDLAEAEKNLSYFKEMDAVKSSSNIPRNEWHYITSGIEKCENVIKTFRK